MNIAAPYKTYNGGKSGNGCYQQIINCFPPMQEYHELFVGNGGIFRRLRLPARTVINDLDGSVINKYKKLRSKKIFVFNEDALGLLAEINGNASYTRTTLIYLDPPYRKEVCKSKRPLYKHELTEQQHKKLLMLASNSKCNVVISHYPDALYNAMLKGWTKVDFKSMTRAGLVTERIYFNYPKPLLLQEPRYIGNDYREREIIKRKTKRWINRLHKMDKLQRISILSSITAGFTEAAAALIHHQK